MEKYVILITALVYCVVHSDGESETILSSVLTPDKNVIRQQRSYYERYGYGRPYDRLDDRPSRCGRCDDDDDDDDDDDYDRGRDRDDDKRSNRPTYGSRHDKNKNYNDDDDRRYDDDRNKNKNGTGDDGDDKRRPHDDKDRDRHSRRKNKHRNRYDDRDRYRPDYYDRFLRDPYRDRYDDPYSRRPYDRYPDRYNDYGRYDEYAYSGYRRPYYDNRYDRGNGYDDSYGGYGPGVGRGPLDSFRPWDETYRGQAGWDDSGRGYYFASGRPDASAWGQREYSRPATSGSWQNSGYSGYSGYTGSVYSNPGYASTGYGGYQDNRGYGYGQGQSSGWQNVGERRPYRDQSGVANLDRKPVKDNRYGQNQGYSQIITYQPGTYTQSSTTPATSYLFQRDDEIVTQETTLKV